MRHFSGWVCLHRKLFENELFWGKQTNIALFAWLMAMANHTASKFKGETVQRGEVFTSTYEMAEVLGVCATTVGRSLKKMESEKVLQRRPLHKGTVITILNYSKYQDLKSEAAAQEISAVQHACSTAAAQLQHTCSHNEQDNNINNENHVTTRGGLRAIATPTKVDLKKWALIGATRVIATFAECQRDEVLAQEKLGPNIWKILEAKYPTNTWGNWLALYSQSVERKKSNFFQIDLKEHFAAFIPLLTIDNEGA